MILNFNALFGYKGGKRRGKKWIVTRKWEKKEKKRKQFSYVCLEIGREGKRKEKNVFFFPLFGLSYKMKWKENICFFFYLYARINVQDA